MYIHTYIHTYKAPEIWGAGTGDYRRKKQTGIDEIFVGFWRLVVYRYGECVQAESSR